jgi:hypothetical protein
VGPTAFSRLLSWSVTWGEREGVWLSVLGGGVGRSKEEAQPVGKAKHSGGGWLEDDNCCVTQAVTVCCHVLSTHLCWQGLCAQLACRLQCLVVCVCHTLELIKANR